MKSLLILATFLGTFFVGEDYISPCGSRVPEREESHQVLNPEFIDPNPEPIPSKPENDKTEWKEDPSISEYEYYDKPNGTRVCRPKTKEVKHRYPDLPKVLNPEFL